MSCTPQWHIWHNSLSAAFPRTSKSEPLRTSTSGPQDDTQGICQGCHHTARHPPIQASATTSRPSCNQGTIAARASDKILSPLPSLLGLPPSTCARNEGGHSTPSTATSTLLTCDDYNKLLQSTPQYPSRRRIPNAALASLYPMPWMLRHLMQESSTAS
jgi:hypothetical protein